MKVYLAVNGIGLGHVKRCEILAEKLKKNGNEVIFSSYLDGLDYVKWKGFNIRKVRPLSYIVDRKGSVDYGKTLRKNGWTMGFMRFFWQIVDEIRNLKNEKPDVVLVDSRASTILAAKMLGLPIILLINQFNVEMLKDSISSKSVRKPFFYLLKASWFICKYIIEKIWTLSDLILVPDFPPPLTIAKYNLGKVTLSKKIIHYIGPLVEFNFKYPDRARLEHELSLTKNKPLVYAAVSGPRYERRLLASKLKKILPHLKDYQCIITEGESTIPPSTEYSDNLINFSWIEDELQYTLLKECDILVCRAGHGIITKAFTYGKSMILIPIPGQSEQRNNATRVKELGYGEVIEQEELNIQSLREALKRMLHLNLGKKRISPYLPLNPADEAARLIQELVENKKDTTLEKLTQLIENPIRSR